jgi:hypothetical protein
MTVLSGSRVRKEREMRTPRSIVAGLIVLACALALTVIASASADTRSAAPAPTPVDGVYEVTFTAEELAASGAPPSEVNPQTYGDFTVVLDRGWIRYTQKSDGGSGWGAGTFKVKGNRMVWTWLAGGGVPTDGDHARPGKVDVCEWSIFRKQVKWSALPGKEDSDDCPWEARVKPWSRVSDAPSVTFKTPANKLEGTWAATRPAGRFVLVLRGLRFSLGRKAAQPRPGNRYEVLGNAIRFRTAQGQFWDYTWSIDRGVLRFTHPPGEAALEGWDRGLTVKPWRKLG